MITTVLVGASYQGAPWSYHRPYVIIKAEVGKLAILGDNNDAKCSD